MEMGMGLLIQVGEPQNMPAPPRNFPRCGDWTPETQPSSDIYCPQVSSFKTRSASIASTAEPVLIVTYIFILDFFVLFGFLV